MNICYLGIDSGGTNTRALLTDAAGVVLGTGSAGSANPNHYSSQQVQSSLNQAAGEALGNSAASHTLARVFLGSSGISTNADRDTMASLLRGLPCLSPAAPAEVSVEVGSDTRIGLTGGLAGRPGLALVAGTGSACYGINAGGQTFLCGGWGAMADDVGSAPWIGSRAIHAAVRAEDGRRPATPLREIVFGYLQLAEPRQLAHRLHNQGIDRADIGRLAPLVLEAYQGGDQAAAGIVREAVIGLAEMVQAVKNTLFPGSGCEMILVGGLALSGPPFQPLLLEQVQSAVPGVTVRDPELSPVQGAVLEALRAGGVPWSAEVIANLKQGAPQSHV